MVIIVQRVHIECLLTMRTSRCQVLPLLMVLVRCERKSGRFGFLIKLGTSCGMLRRILCPLNRIWWLSTSLLVMFVMTVVIIQNRSCMRSGFVIRFVRFGCQIWVFYFWFRQSVGRFWSCWTFFLIMVHAIVLRFLLLWRGACGSSVTD